jgi:hypothetical protein
MMMINKPAPMPAPIPALVAVDMPEGEDERAEEEEEEGGGEEEGDEEPVVTEFVGVAEEGGDVAVLGEVTVAPSSCSR